MSLLHAQILASLDWLESRGLSGLATERVVSNRDRDPSISTLDVKGFSKSKCLLAFYSSIELHELEWNMLQKIAQALGYTEGDYQIFTFNPQYPDVSPTLTTCPQIIALGEASAQGLSSQDTNTKNKTVLESTWGGKILIIPHPRAMLKEPSLKASAWAALQTFKAKEH